ncbi:hypothetical protein [Actinoplanes palleronii]|uniref:Uncharacterized protein n=1 Tax=Actinoplanes palleronii TaxID=113570 RepID=A0ABQ4B1U0_9ACTN|nr:hypothetical protein [Actinoplanes palleronii]GIE64546.1 hypothetical protein Apa02nite_006540 [Actinoplanes palleronii]
MSDRNASVVARAEVNLARLRQARELEKDQETYSRVRKIVQRAVEARAALEAAHTACHNLSSYSVRPGIIAGNLFTDSKKARTDLRQAATNSLRGAGVGRVDRLVAPAVHDALKTAENLAKQRLVDLNKAVDAWRNNQQPVGIKAEIIDLPNFPGSARIRLQRCAAALTRPVAGLPADQLLGKIEELLTAISDWQALKNDYDAALEREGPEIRAFLSRAGSADGASWSLVTPLVRRWLDNAEDVDVVRIRLT